MLKKISIERFKNLESVTLELDKINVLIGSNNSGKSSILQAIQFSISAAQTSLIYGQSWKVRNVTVPVFSTSVLPEQLIYTPLQDVYKLSYKKILPENIDQAIKVSYVQNTLTESDETADIIIRRGRNKNIIINVYQRSLGEQLQSLENPYSIYVIGLAGIAHSETYLTPSIVRKALPRGDSNKIFRNVLWSLKSSSHKWNIFEQDFKEIFPTSDIKVVFNPERDDFIEVLFKQDNHEIPIDLAGTGVLQILQILSYVNFYQPKLLLLDEPDSHLHPNNQRELAKILIKLAETRKLQIILTSHSRHLLDALYRDAKIFWMQKGKIVNHDNDDFDLVKLLLDIGALDQGELLLKTNQIKCVILTEDSDTKPIEKVLESSYFRINEFVVLPYEGCSKIENAKIFANFMSYNNPEMKIVIHRDRDYLTDEEAEKEIQDLENINIICFLTTGTDIESHFISATHINSLYTNLTINKIQELIHDSTNEIAEKSKEKFINSRIDIETKKNSKSKHKSERVNPGAISSQCYDFYNNNPQKYLNGKLVLKNLKNKLQQTIGGDIDLFQVTDSLKACKLEQVAKDIWPDKKEDD